MLVKIEGSFEKTRHIKNNDKFKKMSYEDKEMRYIMIEFFQIKRNLIIQNSHKCVNILS